MTMKKSMRGMIDPYGISLVLAIVGTFFFENAQNGEEQSRYEQEPTESVAQAVVPPSKLPHELSAE